MPKSKAPKLIAPTPVENAAINRAIARDPDTYEVTATDAPKLRRFRGPQAAPRKVSVTVRLAPQTIAYFRALGSGWQTQLDAVLAQWVHRRQK